MLEMYEKEGLMEKFLEKLEFIESEFKKYRDENKPKTGIGPGMPQSLMLEQFGQIIYETFGHMSYQVGSSLEGKVWRDIDVRLIIPDDEYKAMKLGHPAYTHMNRKWRGLVLAFSALGKEMTGLPIDFQIQQQSYANKCYKGQRSALFIVSEEPDWDSKEEQK